MTEFGASTSTHFERGRVETFHGTDCSQELAVPRMAGPQDAWRVRVRHAAYDFQWINFYFCRYFGQNPFGHFGRRIADFYAGPSGK